MFPKTEVIVTQLVMIQYIVASLSLSVISQRQIYWSLHLPKFMIKFQKQNITSKAISAFAENNGSSAEHWFYPFRTRSDQLFRFFIIVNKQQLFINII